MIVGLDTLAEHRLHGRKPARVELDCTAPMANLASRVATINGLSSWWHVAMTARHSLERLDLRPLLDVDLVEVVGTERDRVERLAALCRPLAGRVIATQVQWQAGTCQTVWQDFGDGDDAVAT